MMSNLYHGMPLTFASFLLFCDRGAMQRLLISGSFFDSKKIEEKIYKVSGQLFIEREFFFELWEKISHQDVIISSYSFNKFLKVDKKTFDVIIDTNQRVKALKGSYYTLSYVNKVMTDNHLSEV